MIKRKDILITKKGKKAYQVVGRTGRDIVLAPVDTDDEQCLIYTENEILEIFEAEEETANKKVKALFGRKVSDLEELKDLTRQALNAGDKAKSYIVSKEIELDAKEFEKFIANFLEDQPWIGKEDTCIRVRNKETAETVLVDPQGYEYPRYVSLEIN
ncbi:MAG: hypothetical protein ACLSV2_08305 [Clostridium sp.]